MTEETVRDYYKGAYQQKYSDLKQNSAAGWVAHLVGALSNSIPDTCKSQPMTP